MTKYMIQYQYLKHDAWWDLCSMFKTIQEADGQIEIEKQKDKVHKSKVRYRILEITSKVVKEIE